VRAAAATLMPLVDAIRTHVFAAAPIHADDTTVPVLGKGKTRPGRMWAYVRDDRPFAGPDPPAAVFFYSPDRGGVRPQQHLAGSAGLMQPDAYSGFGRLYEASRQGRRIITKDASSLANGITALAGGKPWCQFPHGDRRRNCMLELVVQRHDKTQYLDT
jgi:hypothetical protein